jgi:hypothetical protein
MKGRNFRPFSVHCLYHGCIKAKLLSITTNGNINETMSRARVVMMMQIITDDDDNDDDGGGDCK